MITISSFPTITLKQVFYFIFTLGLVAAFAFVCASIYLCAVVLQLMIGAVGELFSLISSLYIHGDSLTRIVLLLVCIYLTRRAIPPLHRHLKRLFFPPLRTTVI